MLGLFLLLDYCTYDELRYIFYYSPLAHRESSVLWGRKHPVLDLRQGVFFPTIQKILDEREESNKRYTSIHHRYNNLTTGITQALAEASNAWYQEYTLIPGMKVVLENLRNGDTSMKTIKSLSERSSEPLLRFTDGTYTPVNSNRILKLSTWIVNNDRYKNIATTLKIPIAGVSF